jgi:hypothetical protein
MEFKLQIEAVLNAINKLDPGAETIEASEPVEIKLDSKKLPQRELVQGELF